MTQLARDIDLLQDRIGIFNIRSLRRVDRLLTVLAFVLSFIGILSLYSASTGGPTIKDYYIKQVVNLVFAVGVTGILVCIDYRFLVSLAPLSYVVSLVLLLLVLVLGYEAKGGQRWLPLGFRALQPSELAKLALIYMLAWYLTVIRDRIRKLPYLLIAFAIAGVPAALILKQPNLGTALTLVPVTLVLVFVAGCRRRHLIALALIAAIAAPIVYSNLKPYQKARIENFFRPSDNPEDRLKKLWQPIQTRIAVGSGRLFGSGLAKGTQTHMNYLPEYQTDFIFALLAEETGFVGTTFIIGLYALVLVRGLGMARRCPEPAGALLGVGAVAILFVHVFVNIGITIGILPVTGLPLPFLSYGGSFLLTAMMCIGILLSLSIRRGLFDNGS